MYRLLGINEIIGFKEFRHVIKDLVHKYSLKEQVQAVNVIEEYGIDGIVSVIIARRGETLYYIVLEPDIDVDKYSDLIAVLLRYGTECNDISCACRVIEEYAPRHLNIFLENPHAILYHYMKIRSGYGPLYPIILDKDVEEISCDQSSRRAYIIHRRYSWYGWMPTNVIMDEDTVETLVLALARRAGRHLSLSTPITEGLTPEGVRIALTFSNEVSRHGSSLVLRKRAGGVWTITKAINSGMISPMAAAYLWLILDLRGSILIVGGMGSGKTTLLQALLSLIPPSRKVITIEDTPEITSSTGLWDPLVVRASAAEELTIDEYKLLKFALRRRADYIVVGEVRGVEARLLIQASRLGHGTMATLHADNAHQAIERLIAPPISIPRNLLSSIWAIVVMEPAGRGHRRVKEIDEITHDAKRVHEVVTYDNVSREYIPNTVTELVAKSIRLREVLERDVLIQDLEERILFLSRLVNNGVFEINKLSRELQKFYSIESSGALNND